MKEMICLLIYIKTRGGASLYSNTLTQKYTAESAQDLIMECFRLAKWITKP